MELVFVFAIVFCKVLLINLFEVAEIIGAFGIDTFMYDEVLALFLWNKGAAAVGAAELHGREAVFSRGEPGVTDLAQHLPFGAVVSVEVRHGSITAWAGTVLWDVAFRAAVYGADLFAIAFFDVGNELPVSPALAEVSDERQLVSLEFLVFWGMRIIESPLFEWNVSADKHDQPAVLLIKVLNKL